MHDLFIAEVRAAKAAIELKKVAEAARAAKRAAKQAIERSAQAAASRKISGTDQSTPEPLGYVGTVTDSVTAAWSASQEKPMAKRGKLSADPHITTASTPPRDPSLRSVPRRDLDNGMQQNPAPDAPAVATDVLPLNLDVETTKPGSKVKYGDAAKFVANLSTLRPWKPVNFDCPPKAILQTLVVRRVIDLMLPLPESRQPNEQEILELGNLFAETASEAAAHVFEISKLLGFEWLAPVPQTVATWLGKCCREQSVSSVPSDVSAAAIQRQLDRCAIRSGTSVKPRLKALMHLCTDAGVTGYKGSSPLLVSAVLQCLV